MRNVPPGRGRDLEALVAAHSGLVRSFFLRRCACPEDAEDLAQESFLAIVEALPRFRVTSATSTWIWTICRHVFARHLRTKAARERALASFVAVEAPQNQGEGAEASFGDDARLAIESVLERLGPGDRLLYRCAYLEGLGIREIARLLGRPEGTIKYQLHILRARLGEALGAGGRRGGPCPR